MGILDYLLLFLIGAAMALAIGFMVKNRKKGGCVGCHGNCGECSFHTPQEKEKNRI